MTSNKNRLSNGMNIYDDAMRKYIAGVMQEEAGDDWFSERITKQLPVRQAYRLTEKLEQEHAGFRSTGGPERALEITDYPHVVRANRDLFRDLCSRNSANVATRGGLPLTWMHEIADWRNVHAHPPPNDLRSADVDRVLDAMIRVLSLCDQTATSQVRQLITASGSKKIVVKSKRPNEQLPRAQVEREEARRERALTQSEHQRATRKLAEARQFEENARKLLREAEQVREEANQSALITKQRLSMVREQHREMLREKTFSSAKQRQPTLELDKFRNMFEKASTGNGWVYKTDVGDWQVTRWLGQVQGYTRACIFAPGKRTHSGWINSQRNPLIQEQFESEEKGFAWLYEQDQSGRVGKIARESILNYERSVKQPQTVEDEFDDDIPF